MKKVLFLLLLSIFCCTYTYSITTLDKNGTTTRLIVDDKPFLIIGGELGNSSASSAADIERIFPKLNRMNLNTVLVPVYWEMLEPEQGKYDFTLTDQVIDQARGNGLKVVFLWFGAWKNSMSCYAPLWLKQDYKKYPRAVTASGKPLEIASVFSGNVLAADKKALTAWLSHVTDYDKDGTVIMLQIENEIGMLEDARDHSAAADNAYNKGVPEALTRYLKKNEKILHADILARWTANGKKMKGSWTEVFGDGIHTDEYFMAWNYAGYVEELAKEARRLTSMPLYVNAAMNSRGRKPGQYPSAGPLAHLKDIWKAAAPTLDMLSPDIYDSGFTGWVKQYRTVDNPLFIPEIRRSDANGAQAYYVFGEHDALGFSPFSIEDGSDAPDAKTVKAYAQLRRLIPTITHHQGTGDMFGLYFDQDSTERVVIDDGIKITANHFFTLPWDPRATDGSVWPEAGGIVIRVAPMEYIIAGTGLVVKFEDPTESDVKRRLGEDGFANAGNDDTQAKQTWKAKRRIGLGPVRQLRATDDGRLEFVRQLNGDQTHQGRHVRIGVDDFEILHVKLYQY